MKIENDRVQAIALFKKHVLELVDAAAKPFHANFRLTNQGCACAQSIENAETLNALNVIVTSMLIIHNEHSYVEKIRKVDDVSKAREKLYIPLSAMQSIEKLVDLLRNTTDAWRLDSIGDKLKTHFDNYTPNQSIITKVTGYFNVSLMSATKCYELMLAIEYNRAFFDNYLRGFSLVRDWMRKLRAREPRELRSIIDNVAGSRLLDPPSDFKKAEFDRNVSLLQRRYLSKR